MNKIQGSLRILLKSPLYVLAASLFTLSILLRIIPSSPSLDLLSLLNYIPASELGELSFLLDNLDTISYQIAGWMTGLNIAIQLPNILIAIAVWLMFYEGMQKSRPMSITGLTIIKVLYIIKIVVYSLLTAIMAILGIWLCAKSNSLWGIILILLPIPALLFCILLLKTLNNMTYTLSANSPARYVSGYVIVIGWIIGICTFISAFFSGSIFAGICAALTWIFFSVILSQYKRTLRNI